MASSNDITIFAPGAKTFSQAISRSSCAYPPKWLKSADRAFFGRVWRSWRPIGHCPEVLIPSNPPNAVLCSEPLCQQRSGQRGVSSRGGHPGLLRIDAGPDRTLGPSSGPVRLPPRRVQVFRKAQALIQPPTAWGRTPTPTQKTQWKAIQQASLKGAVTAGHRQGTRDRTRRRAQVRLPRATGYQEAQRRRTCQAKRVAKIRSRSQLTKWTFSLSI